VPQSSTGAAKGDGGVEEGDSVAVLAVWLCNVPPCHLCLSI